ncbi:ARF32 ARF type transcription factor [Zea mays]|uniref:ARF32 ARF type transcription factor n=1 Tax=Zea mays TaxID=4577 RepID=A0A1D6KEJ3_MAIZE|nr:ARF32 ARF type transcription factor [Zea mays]
MATQQPLPPADCVGDNTVDRDVWLACAAPFSRIPTVGDEVDYFPDGHIEQHLSAAPQPLPAQHRFHCTVTDVSLGVDDKTDEVFAKISLRPRPGRAAAPPPGPGGSSNSPAPSPPQKLRYFTKELSQTDVYARFRIPLDNEHVLPIPMVDTDGVQRQDVVMRDTSGKSWRFSKTYSVNPSKQHSLTTGWLDFAKAKRLAAGDKIVFMRRPNGDLIVGVRRLDVPRYPLFDFQGPDPDQPAQDVMEAVRLAAAGRPFTVTYFPRQAAVEFIVPRSEVDDALATSWEPGALVRMEVMEDENRQYTMWVVGRVEAIRQNIWRMLEVLKLSSRLPSIGLMTFTP